MDPTIPHCQYYHGFLKDSHSYELSICRDIDIFIYTSEVKAQTLVSDFLLFVILYQIPTGKNYKTLYEINT